MHNGMRLSEQLRGEAGDYSSTTGKLMTRQKKVRKVTPLSNKLEEPT
jgi:hypothetical protein